MAATADGTKAQSGSSEAALSALFAQGGGEVSFTLDAQGTALCLHSADSEPLAAPDSCNSAYVDTTLVPAATNVPSVMPPPGVMNRVGQNVEAMGARRIGKSSDPDHPFHPCDDVDSDDAAIEALLDSSSRDTRGTELDYTNRTIRSAIPSLPPALVTPRVQQLRNLLSRTIVSGSRFQQYLPLRP
eukprot:3007028-Pleurochrysis_carterae.AAC.2